MPEHSLYHQEQELYGLRPGDTEKEKDNFQFTPCIRESIMTLITILYCVNQLKEELSIRQLILRNIKFMLEHQRLMSGGTSKTQFSTIITSNTTDMSSETEESFLGMVLSTNLSTHTSILMTEEVSSTMGYLRQMNLNQTVSSKLNIVMLLLIFIYFQII